MSAESNEIFRHKPEETIDCDLDRKTAIVSSDVHIKSTVRPQPVPSVLPAPFNPPRSAVSGVCSALFILHGSGEQAPGGLPFGALYGSALWLTK